MSQATSDIFHQSPSKRMVQVVGALAVLVILCTGALFPISDYSLAPVPAFLPMYAMAVILIEGMTAYFLAIQFWFAARLFMAALAGAYGFVVVMVSFQIAVFPGVFSTFGLLEVGPQGAPWLWVIWHAGFPVFVLIALLFYWHHARSPVAPNTRSPHRLLGSLLMYGPPVIGLVVAAAVVIRGRQLPVLIHGESYAQIVDSFLTPLVIILGLVALVASVLVTRVRDLLGLWLSLALLAALGDVVLTLFATERYSVGWYAARVMSLASSSMVLGFLVWEISGLYRRLLDSHRRLEDRVTYDGLTQAYNRGYFTDHLKRTMAEARAQSLSISLLMIDADYFKGYNDHQGHQKGDRCLVAIVGAIKKVLRRTGDCVARYGGEEFVVVLPGATAQTAQMIAEQIHRQIEQAAIPRFDGVSPRVTVSIGIATYDGLTGPMDHEELIRRADAALYRAKHAGRNTSAVFAGP